MLRYLSLYPPAIMGLYRPFKAILMVFRKMRTIQGACVAPHFHKIVCVWLLKVNIWDDIMILQVISQDKHKYLKAPSMVYNIHVSTFLPFQRFTNEDHLAVHKHKHEMTLKFGPARTDFVIIAGMFM